MFFNTVITIIIVLTLIYIYYRLKSDDEGYLPLKLIGYYFLGTFRFNFNKLSLPLGFLIFLLFFRPQINSRAKKAAAILGLIIFIVGITAPAFSNAYFERTRVINSSSQYFYSMDLKNDFEAITSKLEIKVGCKLDNLNITYENDGKFRDLRYDILSQVENGYIIYHVWLDQTDKKYRIDPVKVDSWVQYPRLSDAFHFFELFDRVSPSDLKTGKSWDYYTINSLGFINIDKNYISNNRKVYNIINGKPAIVPEKSLPYGGDCIIQIGSAKTSENSWEGREYIYYFLN